CRNWSQWRHHVTTLGTVTQVMIHQHQCQHGFGNRRGAHAHAWIVTTLGHHVHRIAVDIHRAAGNEQAGSGLQRHRYAQGLAGADATEHTTGVVAEKSLRRDLVTVLFTALFHHRKTVTDFHRLDRVDAHHGTGQIRIQSIEHRL